MKLTKLNIRTGLLLAFIGITGMVIVSAGLAFITAKSITDSQAEINERAGPASIAAAKLAAKAQYLGNFVDRLDRADSHAEISALAVDFRTSLDEARQLIIELESYSDNQALDEKSKDPDRSRGNYRY